MDELAKEYVIDFFTKRLLHFKDKPESVGWSEEGQILRYSTILKLINPEGKSLLDFGCGKGDFYGYLLKRKISCNYIGIDINPHLIQIAKEKYNGANFIQRDIEKEPLKEKFHYTVAIGVFNLAVEGIEEQMKRCLEILFNHTTVKLIFTCLNKNTRTKDIGLTYFEKGYLVNIAQRLTEKYTVLDDLIEGDLFLILER